MKTTFKSYLNHCYNAYVEGMRFQAESSGAIFVKPSLVEYLAQSKEAKQLLEAEERERKQT